jgi:hypothetical protein
MDKKWTRVLISCDRCVKLRPHSEFTLLLNLLTPLNTSDRHKYRLYNWWQAFVNAVTNLQVNFLTSCVWATVSLSRHSVLHAVSHQVT